MLTQNVIPAQNQSIPVKLPVTDQVQQAIRTTIKRPSANCKKQSTIYTSLKLSTTYKKQSITYKKMS